MGEIKVMQEDREAAADILEVVSTLSKGGIQNIRDGKADGFHVVQSYARHREQAERRIVEWLMDPTRTGLHNRDMTIALRIQQGAHRHDN